MYCEKVNQLTCVTKGDLKSIWGDVKKIIDTLHIRNHKEKKSILTKMS